jgi:NAD(P)-dependent dehydrogenase (short-subunit alcohol dehydrogenase family)
MAATTQFPSFDLTGRRVLITGATKGIGRHAALSLANAGADLFLSGRDQSELRSLADEVRALGRRAETLAAELADVAQAEQLGRAALEALGGIDVLINNAGIARIEPFFETSVENWDATLDVNLRAPFFLSKVVGKAMAEAGRGGKIINVASQAALVALEGHGAYCASKAGMLLMTKVMALELGPYNIQVNAICPTVILTPMGEQVWGDPAKGDPMKAKIPLGKFGYPVDVSGAIIFLASPASDMITGSEVVIDGGYTAI